MFTRLRHYLNLGVIVGTMPNQITDGQLIDAVPVMANFNYIASQVNANVPPLIPTASSILTYVPTVNFGGASVGITYGSQKGAYVTVGNLVFFTLSVVLTSKGSSVGALNITVPPLTISANWMNGANAVIPCYGGNITFTNMLAGYLEAGTTLCTIVNIASAANPVIITDAGCTNTSSFNLSGFYSV